MSSEPLRIRRSVIDQNRELLVLLLISERALERAGHCVHGAREGSDTDLQPPLNRGAYGSVATETSHGEGERVGEEGGA